MDATAQQDSQDMTSVPVSDEGMRDASDHPSEGGGTTNEGATSRPNERPAHGQEKKTVPESVKKGKSQGWMQDRLSHYAQETRAAREEARQVREELKRLQEGQVGAGRMRDGQPSPDDYQRYDDYVDALVDWKMQKKAKESQAQSEQSQNAQDYQRRRQAFDVQAQQYAALYDDPQAVMESMFSHEIPVSQAMSEAIMDLGEKGPAVLFHLSQNPLESMQIAQLSPIKATMRIALLGEQVGWEQPRANGVGSQAPQRQQPRAVPQVRGGSPAHTLDGQPHPKDSVAEWAQKEAARLRAKYGQNYPVYVPRG